MRRFAGVVVAWSLAAANVAPAAAQAWLTVGGADGSFKIEMPIPFDMPETHPGGTVTFACVHQTPELSLRFEVLNTPMTMSEQAANRGILVDRIEDGSHILQTRVYVVGHRTFRLIAHSTPELEADPMIQRFLTSVRLAD
jgi:hypothetical protein